MPTTACGTHPPCGSGASQSATWGTATVAGAVGRGWRGSKLSTWPNLKRPMARPAEGLAIAVLSDRPPASVGPTGAGLAHGFVLACLLRNASSPASDTSTHVL